MTRIDHQPQPSNAGVSMLRPPKSYSLTEQNNNHQHHQNGAIATSNGSAAAVPGVSTQVLVDAHQYASMCNDVLALKTLLHQLKATLQKSETTNPFESAINQSLQSTPAGTPTTIEDNLPNGQIRVLQQPHPPAAAESELVAVLRQENDELRRQLAERDQEIDRLKRGRAVATVRPQPPNAPATASNGPINVQSAAPMKTPQAAAKPLVKPTSLLIKTPTSPPARTTSSDV